MNILEIKEPLILDNVLTKRDNLTILDWLFSEKHWRLATNYLGPGKRLSKALINNVQHAGFTHTSASIGHENFLDDPLNLYTLVIANQISERCGFDYKKIYRTNWNYYCKNQKATPHIDDPKENLISIIYNLHTTDGGTIILDKEYKDVASQAKIFKSNWEHSSSSVTKDKGRVSVNILLEI